MNRRIEIQSIEQVAEEMPWKTLQQFFQSSHFPPHPLGITSNVLEGTGVCYISSDSFSPLLSLPLANAS